MKKERLCVSEKSKGNKINSAVPDRVNLRKSKNLEEFEPLNRYDC